MIDEKAERKLLPLYCGRHIWAKKFREHTQSLSRSIYIRWTTFAFFDWYIWLKESSTDTTTTNSKNENSFIHETIRTLTHSPNFQQTKATIVLVLVVQRMKRKKGKILPARFWWSPLACVSWALRFMYDHPLCCTAPLNRKWWRQTLASLHRNYDSYSSTRRRQLSTKSNNKNTYKSNKKCTYSLVLVWMLFIALNISMHFYCVVMESCALYSLSRPFCVYVYERRALQTKRKTRNQ